MHILIVGSGGREHALAWKVAQSPKVTRVSCAPGNAGTASFATNVGITASDLDGLVDFAARNAVDLTIIGPDDALADGLADRMAAARLRVFGPVASAARLESSKAFAKDFMRRHGIPTARSEEFTDSLDAHDWCRTAQYPLVIKADGLALGKGVVIAQNALEAAQAIHRSMDLKCFGGAGQKIIIEEFLVGRECSIHAMVDRSGYCVFPDARDHKRAWDGDHGPNTGGMGTISPSGELDEALWSVIRSEVLDRFVQGLEADGITFRGMLFPGLILTADGPKVLEFNCRFGDPETQVLMRRLESDLPELLLACTEDRVAGQTPQWDAGAAACIVLASGGYPSKYETGKPIHGLEDAAMLPGVVVFHAGTRLMDGQPVTSGGRVLGVTARGDTIGDACQAAYHAADTIRFDGMHRREDIGKI